VVVARVPALSLPSAPAQMTLEQHMNTGLRRQPPGMAMHGYRPPVGLMQTQPYAQGPRGVGLVWTNRMIPILFYFHLWVLWQTG